MHLRSLRGMGIIDVIVAIALMLTIFMALFGVLRASLQLSALAKAKAVAIELASAQMEYMRGLSYSSIGTVGGTPSGSIAPSTTTSVNGGTYTVQTAIAYYDDAADGTSGSDTNNIKTDYKKANVTVSFTVGGRTNSVVLVSNFAPPAIET